MNCNINWTFTECLMHDDFSFEHRIVHIPLFMTWWPAYNCIVKISGMESERKYTVYKLNFKNDGINKGYHYYPSLSNEEDSSDCTKYIKQLIDSYDTELNDKIITVDHDLNRNISAVEKRLNKQLSFSFQTNNIELVKNIDFYCRRKVNNL